ncbi:MAG: hypothetical protein WCE53_13680 [Candidatus Acidiferrum sp.]
MPTRHRLEAEKFKMTGWTWFPFDVVDWLTSEDVLRMTAAERGVYITLLCVQWRDGFVPSRPQIAAKVSGFRPEMLRRWLAKWPHLFPVSTSNPAHLMNAKLKEIAVEKGNPKAEQGTEERRGEERRVEESRERGEVAPRSGASLTPEEKKDKPSTASQRRKEQPQDRKPCGCADGLCDWSEPIPGCSMPPTRIGDCVYYQRLIKRNDYFATRLSRGYLLSQWQRVVADTPEDYSYDPDPLLKEHVTHLDGGDTYVGKEVTRRPKNAKERALLQKNITANRKWLYDPVCPKKCREGLVFVSDYPDARHPAQRMIGHSDYSECVGREE